MKRGILGGTFDPVHIGHMRLAVEAKEALQLDEVVLEVAARSPIKTDQPATDAEVRFRMVSEATSTIQGLSAGRKELDRPAPSYTVESLQAHAEPEVDIWFVMGSDTLQDFPKWREPERILKLCRLAVGCRLGYDVSQLVREQPGWLRGRVDSFTMPLFEISSSDIRRRISLNLSIRHLVPDCIIGLIERYHLYR